MTAGVPILTNIISGWRLLVEIAWGADLTADPVSWTWEDITTDVLQDNGSGVTITVGRGNGAQFAQPANCSIRLKNQNGAYTPASAVSFNYPFVRLGTPVRVSVSLNGGSAWSVRFQGEASSWSPAWDAQGKKAYVVLIASGSTRRLGSGSKPLRSPLTRAILATTATTLHQYWPLEDGTAATGAASVVGGPEMTTSGTVQFGSFNASSAALTLSPGVTYGTDLLPQLNSGGELTATFPAGSSSSWTVQFTNYCDVFTATGTTVTVAEWLCPGSTYPRWTFISDSDPAHLAVDATRVVVYNTAGAATTVCSFPGIAVLAEIRIDAAQSGSNIDVTLGMITYLGESFTDSGALSSATLAGVNTMTINPDETSIDADYAIGHVRIWDGNSAPDFQTGAATTSAWTSYKGEAVDDRLSRLCDEEGVDISITGSAPEPMGPQGIDTFFNLLRECESTNVGFLFDGLTSGLTYTCRSALYSQDPQLTIDANSGHVPATPGPLPALDDQRLVNRMTVTNANGSSVVFEDADGPFGTAAIGVFDNRVTVNASNNTSLGGIARWLVHIGTTAGMRYPQIPLDLAAAPELASSWVDMVPTDSIALTNVGEKLSQHPGEGVSLLGEGWTEFIASRQWRAAINSSNYRPWEVFKIGDSRLGRIQTGGSTVRSFATSTSTSIAVDNSSAGWSTAGLPFDVDIEGEQITVTAISGSTTPQTLTVTRSVNRVVKDHNTGAVVELWKPGVIAL